MRCTISTSTNPYFNLAAEEFFLKNSNEEMFILYINEPCIVVGKHQNLLSEINLQYVLDNKIKLARRISGGGTVFQDLNNLNFSFIHNCANLEQINFSKFISPIHEALREMELDVEFSSRNDLLIDAKKISGNAMHIFKNRVLSHGTLLFKTDLSRLSAALKNNPQNYIDKSIKSVRSKVTNIFDHLKSSKSINEFKEILFQNIVAKSINPSIEPISEEEKEYINKISTSKFESWEWIYGYSPKYQFQNSFQIEDEMAKIEIEVEKGIIRKAKINIDSADKAIYQHAIESLINTKHDYYKISEYLASYEELSSRPLFNTMEFCANLF